MKPLYRNIHNCFKLNGISFSPVELKEVAYSLIKEGEPFEKEIGDFLLDWLDDNPTLKVHTSGSTGKPKSIMLQKRYMMNSALATGEFFGLRPGNTAVLCLPASYIAGKMMLVRAMVLGLELDYIMPSSNPIHSTPKFYDLCAMVPLQLENSFNFLNRYNTLLVGGAPLSKKTRTELQTLLQTQKISTEVYESYGMTETISHVALKRIHLGPNDTAIAEPYFKTLPNVTVSVDERGCLIIDAPKIAAAPVITNDIVTLISETEFLWMGRFDNVINSGGVKLFPEKIEAKLSYLISSRFFVSALPDNELGEKLILVVEGWVDTEKLFQEINTLKSLEKFEIPKEIRVVSKFMDTENGKIRREATLDLALE